MKITIGGTTYTALRDPSFSPEADVTGNEVPINDLVVDINTAATISIGQFAYFKDDRDNLWAKYWITYAEKIDKNTVRVKAEAPLRILERDIKDPVMYTNEPLADVMADIFDSIGSGEYTIDSSFSGVTISGFCPEQSAKTRLQWVCFVIGAYIKSFFSDKVEIEPLDAATETIIPIGRTFWKPSVTYKDYVTAINVRYYSYSQGTPGTTDAWVTDGTNYYVQTDQNLKLSNPDVPAGVLTHEITVEDITIVNSSNVSAIASHMALYYFKRQEVDLDVINNAEYKPGDRVVVNTDESTLATGYITSCVFRYGLQARSSIHMTPVEVKESAKLTILYKYDDMQIGKAQYQLPVGYAYSIGNPHLDLVLNRHRFIFRPLTAAATGTMVAGGATVTVNYEIALDYFTDESDARILAILAVDEAAKDQSETEVLVIS